MPKLLIKWPLSLKCTCGSDYSRNTTTWCDYLPIFPYTMIYMNYDNYITYNETPGFMWINSIIMASSMAFSGTQTVVVSHDNPLIWFSFRITAPFWKESTNHRRIRTHPPQPPAPATTTTTKCHYSGALMCFFVVGWANCRRRDVADDALVLNHYSDVIMRSMASQIAYASIVYSAICSGATLKKH